MTSHHPMKFAVIGAQVSTPNWTGTPLTLAWHDSASMPQTPIQYYDCPSCNTCWKLGQRLLPDPLRQILKG